MDSVVHFEIPADDPKRATSFYKKAFGWSTQEIQDMGYWMLGTTESNEQGAPKNPGSINGGMGKRDMPLKNITVTISVPDIDEALDKIEKLGGKTVQKKQSIGEMGFTAYFKDSEGNIVGLWQASS
jgi:uncharacterized protein